MTDFTYKFSLAILPNIYVWLSKIWFYTCKATVRDAHYIDEAQSHGAVIVPFWHYSIFYIFYHVRNFPAVALVSASRDGEFIARIAQKLRFGTVRGSSNKQGVQALKKLLKAMKAGKHVGIVADGSQGPPRKMQPGTIYLASKTGSLILPMVWAANKYITFNSWDKTVLPIPFSKIVVRYGKPINIPGKLDNKGIEQYRLQVEQDMNNLYREVWAEFNQEQHD